MGDAQEKTTVHLLELLRAPIAPFQSTSSIEGRLRMAADEIEKLTERCEAYKGQVKAGAVEIERLTERIDDAETSLAIWDAGKSSEYWSRHPTPLKIHQASPAGQLNPHEGHDK